MAKYLSEIEVDAVKLFGQEKAYEFAIQTRLFVFSLSPESQREVLSKYRKVVVSLWPEERLKQKERPIRKYEDDGMGVVYTINIPFDLDVFFSASEGEARNQIVYGIMKGVYSDLPDDIGLDGNIILARLEAFKENGFVVEKETSRAVRSPSKKVGARLRYHFDYSGIRVEVLISHKGEDGEKAVLIGNYSPSDCCLIIEAPAKLVFVDEGTISFTPKSREHSSVTISIK